MKRFSSICVAVLAAITLSAHANAQQCPNPAAASVFPNFWPACGPTNMTFTNLPRINSNNFSVNLVANGGFGSFHALYMGAPTPPTTGIPLPWGGCNLYLQTGSMLLLQSGILPAPTGAGPVTVVHPIPIPNDQSLCDLQLYMQWLVFDTGATELGIVKIGS